VRWSEIIRRVKSPQANVLRKVVNWLVRNVRWLTYLNHFVEEKSLKSIFDKIEL